MAEARYAIYFSPYPESDLWLFGSRWLGRDSATGGALKRLPVRSVTPGRVREITAQATKHGFHAALKAPFYLARSCDRQMLDEALEAFAAAHEPLELAALELAEVDDFIALRPREESVLGQKLAADCVRAFDHFRKKGMPQRGSETLHPDGGKGGSVAQSKLRDQGGHPYVMDEFRFHMPLTDRLDRDERQAVLADLKGHAQGVLGKPLKVDALSLLRQNTPGDGFEVVKCYRFNPLPRPRWPRQKNPPMSPDPNHCRSTQHRRP